MWTRTPYIIQRMFPQILWRMPEEARGVYLTFDDGPDPRWTPAVLELLNRHQARASFFVLGNKVVQNPELVHAAWVAGHSIGSHGFDHRRLLCSSRLRIGLRLEQADAAVAEVTGVTPRLFRPPYGLFGPSLLRACRNRDKQAVLWEVNSHDYSVRSTKDTIARQILTRVRPGSIVLLHDGHECAGRTIAALQIVIPELYRRGYRCLPLSQSVTSREARLREAAAALSLTGLVFDGSSKQSSVAA